MADDEVCEITKNSEGLDEEICYKKTRSRVLDDSLTKRQEFFASFEGNSVGNKDIDSNAFFCLKNTDETTTTFTDCILNNSSKNDFEDRINISKLQDEYKCKSITMLKRDDASFVHDDVFTCYTDEFVKNNKSGISQRLKELQKTNEKAVAIISNMSFVTGKGHDVT